VHTALGLAAHEAQEAEGLPPPPPEPEAPPAEGAEGAGAAAADGGKDGEGGEGEPAAVASPPVALAAMQSLTRGAELAARCGGGLYKLNPVATHSARKRLVSSSTLGPEV
jgi:hypothetical protein